MRMKAGGLDSCVSACIAKKKITTYTHLALIIGKNTKQSKDW